MYKSKEELVKYMRKESRNMKRMDLERGKNFIASKGKQFAIQKVTIKYDSKIKELYFESQKTDIPESAFSRHFDIGKRVLFHGAALTECERATTDIIAVNFSLENYPEYGKQFLDDNKKIYLFENGVLFLTAMNKAYKDTIPVFANKRRQSIPGDVNEYVMFYYVPSGVRQYTALYYRADIPEERIQQIYRNITADTSDELVGQDTYMSKVVKKGARIGLLGVGGVYRDFDLDEYGAVLYTGHFGGKQERTDGGAKISAEMLSDLLNIGRYEARTLFIQARNNKTSKVACTVELQKDIQRFCDIVRRDTRCKIKHVSRWEDIKEYDDNTLIIVGNRDNIGFLSDTNGYKAIPNNSDKENSFCILQFAGSSKMHTNLQLLQFTQNYPGFKDMLVRIGKNHIRKHLRGLVRKHDYIDGCTLNIDKLYISDILVKISTDTLRQGYLARGIERGIISSLNKAIHRMHFDLDGYYMHGTAASENWTCRHEAKLVHDNEVFVNNPKYSGKHVTVTRNPRSNSNETFSATCIWVDTIAERLWSAEYTNTEIIYYSNWYAHMSQHVVVVPGSLEFKDKTGGSDFDYDGFMVCFDTAFNKMLESKKAFRVGIQKSKDKGAEYHVNDTISMLQDAFISNLTTGNRSVSNIAIENSRIQTLLACGDTELQHAMFEYFCERLCGKNWRIVNKKNNAKVYLRQFDGDCDISEQTVLDMVALFKDSPKDDETVKMFLEDTSVMFVSVIGRVIDSAKTGEPVTDPMMAIDEEGNEYCVMDTFHQMFRDTNQHHEHFARIVWDNSQKEFHAEWDRVSFSTQRGKDTHFYIADPIYYAQAELVVWTTKLINKIRSLLKPTESDKEKMSVWSQRLSAAHASLKELDKTSSDMQRINKVSDIDSRAVGERAMNYTHPYIANMIRIILDGKGVAKEDRFEAALSINDIVVGSSFAYNQLKEEALHYACKLENACTTIRERLIPVRRNISTGLQLFKSGRSDQFLCTSYRFEGVYEVKYDTETRSYYLETDITDIIELPESDDRIILRVLTKNADEQDKLISYFNRKDSYTFFITAYAGSHQCNDKLYAVDDSGEPKEICRLLLKNDDVGYALHTQIVELDDVLKESFIKENEKGEVKEINSTTLMCRLSGSQYTVEKLNKIPVHAIGPFQGKQKLSLTI